MSQFTHFNASGEAHMVDVGAKQETHRIAIAQGTIRMQTSTLQLILQGDAKKGDVLGVARIAAIQASKKTADLIPLCHPIALTKVNVAFDVVESENAITCTVSAETYGNRPFHLHLCSE